MDYMRRIIKSQPLFANITLVLAANALLAVIALAREMSIAACFGTNRLADIYVVSLYLNDLPGNLLLGNALYIVMVPIFARMQASAPAGEDHGESSFRLLRLVSIRVIAVYFLWMVLGGLASELLVAHLIPGLRGASRHLAVELYNIMLPMGFFYCLYYLVGAKLNADRKFAEFAFGPVVMNIILLIFLWAGRHQLGINSLAWGSTFGSLAMFLLVVYALLSSGGLRHWQRARREITPAAQEQLKTVWPILAPALLAVLATQLVPFSERYFGSFLPAGNIAALNYAYKLSQFPIWIYTAAVVSVLFPEMTARDETDKEQFASLMRKGLLVILAVLVPVALAMILFSEPIVRILLERQAFVANSTALTAAILSAYSPGIVGWGINLFLIRIYNSMHDTRTPLLAITAASAVTVTGNYLVLDLFGAPGMAACASLGAWITTVILVLKLRKKVPYWWKIQRGLENELGA
jgi:putative peptidoglycan lipid II flippase